MSYYIVDSKGLAGKINMRKIKSLSREFELILTSHAKDRMKLRGISKTQTVRILESGKVLAKSKLNAFWVYNDIATRTDNSVCLSVRLENSNLVVITALVNWRPL